MSDINGTEITDILGLSQAIIKLIDTVACGVGKLYEPIHIKRMGKAKAKELRVMSSAINDNMQLPSRYENGDVAIDATDSNELAKRAQNRFLFQEMQKQQNIESVIVNAYNNLENETSVDGVAVDRDWILRFFDSVANVSNEQMQIIWGKILSGEVKQSGSFSLRTLECVKNLSQKEAKCFQKVLPFMINITSGWVIPYNGEILDKYGILYTDLLELEELGLIQMKTGLSINLTVNSNPEQINNGNVNIVVISTDKAEHKVTIPIMTLTSIGNELVSIFDVEVNVAYLIDFLKNESNKMQNSNIRIRLNQLVVEGTSIRFKDLLTEQ